LPEIDERKRSAGEAAATSGARRLGAAAAKQFLRLRRGRAPQTVATDETSLELGDAGERATIWGPT